MPQIDLRIQAIAKQIGRNRRGALSGSGLMPHAKTLAEIARNPSAGIIFPAISTCYFRAYLAVWERLFGFFRDDLLLAVPRLISSSITTLMAHSYQNIA